MRAALAFAALLALTGCPAAKPADGPLRFAAIAQEAYSSAKAPRQEVLRDAKAWQTLWSEVQHKRMLAPPVDFEKQMVLFAALGERRTGGYAIEVVRVEVVEGTIVVHLRETRPVPGAVATMALTAPFTAVVVPRSELPVRWFNLP